MIAGGSLRAEDKGPGIEIHFRMLLDLIVQIDHMQDVQQLSLVLMQTFDLYIKDGVRVYFHAVMLQDILGQTFFVAIFNVHEFLQRFLIIRIDLQLADLGKIRDPVRSDMLGDPFGKQRIAMNQETSLRDAVGLIVELLRHHLVEVFQLLILQDLSMESCHAVYGEACRDGQMSHLDLAVIDDGHLLDLLIVARILSLDLQDEPAVDLFDDLIYTRKQAGEQVDRPFLQSFGHDGMVGIGHALCGHLPCLVPAEAFFVHQDTHQFGHRYGGMGIVHLEDDLLVQFCDIVMVLFILLDRSLQRSGHEEVLLFQTKLFTCIVIVVGVQNFH